MGGIEYFTFEYRTRLLLHTWWYGYTVLSVVTV